MMEGPRHWAVTFFSWTKVNSRSVRLEISSSYLRGEAFFSNAVKLRVWLTVVL